MPIIFEKFKEENKEEYMEMSKEFYSSSAVSSSVPQQHFEDTFRLAIENSPFVDGYMFYSDDVVAGYALLSIGYSNEVGGMEIWIEEIFTVTSHRGLGIGNSFFEFVESNYKDVKRIRLEVTKNNKKAIELYKKNGYKYVPYVQMMKYINKNNKTT